MLPVNYTPYDDQYPTCSSTRVTLRIYPGTVHPSEVSQLLELQPDTTQIQGMTYDRNGHPWTAEIHGWFLSSEGKVESRDSRRHLDWLLDRLEGKGDVLKRLSERGVSGDISCFWNSKHGHAGPELSVSIMRRLSQLELTLWFDVYGPWEITGSPEPD